MSLAIIGLKKKLDYKVDPKTVKPGIFRFQVGKGPLKKLNLMTDAINNGFNESCITCLIRTL